MDKYKGHETKLIADVDCTTATGKPLCEAHGIKGFPSIKYGDPSDLQDYKGGRDAESLNKHAEEKLIPMCSPANIALCDDEKKAEISKYQAMDAAELQKLVDAKSEELTAAETAFKKGVEGLQKAYEELQKTRDAAQEEVKNSGLGLMKSVSKHMAKQATKDEL